MQCGIVYVHLTIIFFFLFFVSTSLSEIFLIVRWLIVFLYSFRDFSGFSNSFNCQLVFFKDIKCVLIMDF
jgi:hypothetical protein